MIEDDINRLDTFYNRGVRYMTLTWNNSPSWASSHAAENSSKYTGPKGTERFWKTNHSKNEPIRHHRGCISCRVKKLFGMQSIPLQNRLSHRIAMLIVFVQ